MDWPRTLSPQIAPMISFSLAAIFKVAFLFLAVVAVVDLLTMSQDRRVLMLSRSGLSQRAIASRLGITRHRVRMALP
jgi:DNA-binding NarL/FixJ family response regulator